MAARVRSAGGHPLGDVRLRWGADDQPLRGLRSLRGGARPARGSDPADQRHRPRPQRLGPLGEVGPARVQPSSSRPSRGLGYSVDAREVLAGLAGGLHPAMVKQWQFWHRSPPAERPCLRAAVPKVPDPRFAEVLALFDVVLQSASVGVRKPDPQFYELACTALGVAPARSVCPRRPGINLKPGAADGHARRQGGRPPGGAGGAGGGPGPVHAGLSARAMDTVAGSGPAARAGVGVGAAVGGYTSGGRPDRRCWRPKATDHQVTRSFPTASARCWRSSERWCCCWWCSPTRCGAPTRTTWATATRSYPAAQAARPLPGPPVR